MPQEPYMIQRNEFGRENTLIVLSSGKGGHTFRSKACVREVVSFRLCLPNPEFGFL
jgi:hypothetical protein